LIDEAIEGFDNLIAKVNGVNGEDPKKQFKVIENEKATLIKSLLTKIAKL